MEELFRFYAIRAPEPLRPEQSISLDTQSSYQTESRRLRGSSPERIRALSESYLRGQLETLARLVISDVGTALRSFDAWIGPVLDSPVESPANFDSTVRSKISGFFKAGPTALRTQENSAGRPVLVKDAIVAMRVLNLSAEGLQPLLYGTDPHTFARTLVMYMRFYQLLELSDAPFSAERVKATMRAKLMTDLADSLNGGAPISAGSSGPTPRERLTEGLQALADLSRLLVRIEGACPSELEDPGNAGVVVGAPTGVRGGGVIVGPPAGVRGGGRAGGAGVVVGPLSGVRSAAPVLSLQTRLALESEFDGLPERIESALHQGIAPSAPQPTDWLSGPWREVYSWLEAQAKELQFVVDNLETQVNDTQAPSAPATNQLATPLAAGYMRMAGMTDVKVVRSHVIGYEDSEIAQIENVLQGETRARRFRNLSRREENTQTQTEKTVTEEKEIKTEDQSSLKSSVENTLKESLDLKVGFDLKAKIGENVQIGLNTSFGFSRSSEETRKASSDFAKDVTNRAARKVAETVRTTIETRLLQETEETIDHGFDAKDAQRNIVGLYQWIVKVNRVQIFTIGDQKRAVLDGVILQPGQRLLGAPAQAGTTVPPAPPPPSLDVLPSDIHPWNYLSLAAKFGASSIPAPPPLTANVSFSSAGPQGQADPKESTFAVGQDLALPEGVAAAYVTVTLSAEVFVELDHENAMAVIGGQTMICVGRDLAEQVIALDNHAKEIRLSETKILAGEKLAIPFTFYGGQVAGYAVAVDVTCVRTQEAYEAWQVSVYGALRSANSKAQQDYNEQAARATLEKAYNVGPSPGKVDQIVREEIKRCVIAVLAKQSASGSFYDDLNNFYALGSYADIAQRCLFFEHALEWENMTYILYPYFWADGRNDGWTKHLNRDEKDDDLVTFLKSGAARVVVPVRPLPKDAGTTVQDFASYLKAMSLPQLPELLDVGSPLYLAITEEVKAKDGAEPETFDDEWEVRVPTELVRLRSDSILPTWSERLDASNNPIKGDFVEDKV